ncbi:MAG TPA: decaprenyl-phosphate phosphoribosyltransferase [Anaerolineaceae bacterium]
MENQKTGVLPHRPAAALIRTMRPRQWLKNVLIFAAVVFDRQLSISHPAPLLRSLAGFALFCMISSTVYIVNDLMDVEADRRHPVKRTRPIAAGLLSVPAAIAAAVVLLLVTLPCAYLLSPFFFAVLTGYFLLNLAYSNWLKHIPILDVLVLATFYVLRVAAGVELITVERFSPWLYVVTTLGALYIGFGKRRAELALLAGDANAHRRVLSGYTIPLLDQFITIVSGTTIVAYSLYTFSAPNVPADHTMMLTIPFVLYGVFRYLYLVQVKQEGGAPEDLIVMDRPLQITVLLWGLSVFLIFYIFKLQ